MGPMAKVAIPVLFICLLGAIICFIMLGNYTDALKRLTEGDDFWKDNDCKVDLEKLPWKDISGTGWFGNEPPYNKESIIKEINFRITWRYVCRTAAIVSGAAG